MHQYHAKHSWHTDVELWQRLWILASLDAAAVSGCVMRCSQRDVAAVSPSAILPAHVLPNAMSAGGIVDSGVAGQPGADQWGGVTLAAAVLLPCCIWAWWTWSKCSSLRRSGWDPSAAGAVRLAAARGLVTQLQQLSALPGFQVSRRRSPQPAVHRSNDVAPVRRFTAAPLRGLGLPQSALLHHRAALGTLRPHVQVDATGPAGWTSLLSAASSGGPDSHGTAGGRCPCSPSLRARSGVAVQRRLIRAWPYRTRSC